MVAAVCEWHERHAAARGEIERRLQLRHALLVPGPALVEAYSVLTRLPAPYRLSPTDALAVLEANFVGGARIVALDAASYRRLLRRAPTAGIFGGRIYDAVIAECALREQGTALLTFNAMHFLSFRAAGLEIVVPGEGTIA
jgi:predicted nucleic acid-binding protein